MSFAIPASILKPLAALAAKWAESALKKWLDRRRAKRKAAGKWGKPIAAILLGFTLTGCGTLNLLLDKATEAWIPEKPPAGETEPPAGEAKPPGEKPPEGHEIETIRVDGDGLWKPDTLTYLLPSRQRSRAPDSGWSANGERILATHIARAEVWKADGSFGGWLRWAGNKSFGEGYVDGSRIIPPKQDEERNYFGSWVKLGKARCSSGDRIKVFDLYGKQIAELPIPDGKKRSEGRR